MMARKDTHIFLWGELCEISLKMLTHSLARHVDPLERLREGGKERKGHVK